MVSSDPDEGSVVDTFDRRTRIELKFCARWFSRNPMAACLSHRHADEIQQLASLEAGSAKFTLKIVRVFMHHGIIFSCNLALKRRLCEPSHVTSPFTKESQSWEKLMQRFVTQEAHEGEFEFLRAKSCRMAETIRARTSDRRCVRTQKGCWKDLSWTLLYVTTHLPPNYWKELNDVAFLHPPPWLQVWQWWRQHRTGDTAHHICGDDDSWPKATQTEPPRDEPRLPS